MGHLRGMRVDREGKKKHIKKCDNCSETELTLDYIFNCPAKIPNLLKIGILPTTINLYEALAL